MGSRIAAGVEARRTQLRDVARELYAGPRESFVTRRAARSKALRDDDDPVLATLVAKLPKPTLLAWAIDRVVAAHAADVELLMETIERMQSPDSATELRTLAARHDELVTQLAHAADVLIGGGRASDLAAAIRIVTVSEAAQSFVDGTLAAIPDASDESLDAALASGAALAPRERSSSTGSATAATRHDASERRRRLRSELAAARAHHRDATRSVREAERSVRDAERELERLEHAAGEAGILVEQLEARLEALD